MRFGIADAEQADHLPARRDQGGAGEEPHIPLGQAGQQRDEVRIGGDVGAENHLAPLHHQVGQAAAARMRALVDSEGGFQK